MVQSRAKQGLIKLLAVTFLQSQWNQLGLVFDKLVQQVYFASSMDDSVCVNDLASETYFHLFLDGAGTENRDGDSR